MIVDYRIYITIYAVALLAHTLSIVLPWGRFWAAQKIIWGSASVTVLAHFLDWLWS